MKSTTAPLDFFDSCAIIRSMLELLSVFSHNFCCIAQTMDIATQIVYGVTLKNCVEEQSYVRKYKAQQSRTQIEHG